MRTFGVTWWLRLPDENTFFALGGMPGGVPRGFQGERIRVGTYKRKRGKSGGEPRVVQRIIPDSEVWDRCCLAWQMRHDGSSIRDIMEATRLFKNVSGYESFFQNLIYTGTLDYGGKRLVSFVPALVPMEWWEEEQARKAERGKKTRSQKMDAALEPRRVGSRHLLSGLLMCGHVEGEEHPMLADCIPAKEGQRRHWDFYICCTKKNSRGCKCESRRIGARALEASVIESLMTHVLTRENLRPRADSIAHQVQETNGDVGIRLNALQAQLAQVERQIDNLLGAIENIGLSPSLKEKLTQREGEKEPVKSEIGQLEKMLVKSSAIPAITDEMIEDWLDHIRLALSSGNPDVAQKALKQFVSKIVIKDRMGMIYYTFPVDQEDGCIGLGKGNVDLRGRVPYTRHKLDLALPVPQSTQSDQLHPDKEQLRSTVLEMRDQGMSYREIAPLVGLHWTRIQQIVKSCSELSD